MRKWILEEKNQPQRRSNLVLLDENNRVIGYQSYMFQDDGRVVLTQAVRIDEKLRGQGAMKKFSQLTMEQFTYANQV